ncbi:hypothetical protein Tco_0783812, partial [Tanacetum coccineum]
KAKEWLDNIPLGTITSWEQLVLKFLDKFFPPDQTLIIKDTILWFRQGERDPIKDAWVRILNHFIHHRFINLNADEWWEHIEYYVQYQDDKWGEPSPIMNIYYILKIIKPTFLRRLKAVHEKLAYLIIPPEGEAILRNPYLICDLCGGAHEANEYTTKMTSTLLGEIEEEGWKEKKGHKQKKDDKREKFLSIFKHIHINLLLLEALNEMPKGAKVLKDLLSNKAKLESATSSVTLSEEFDVAIQKNLPQKKGDPASFTLPCLIGTLSDDCLYFADPSDEFVQEQWVDTLDHDRNWINKEEEDGAEEVQAVFFYLRKEPIQPYNGRFQKTG